MSRLAALLAAVLLLSSCSGVGSPGVAPSSRHGSAPSVAPRLHKLTPREVVHDPGAHLSYQHLERVHGRLEVATDWLACAHHDCHEAIAVSDDGFRTARYFPATRRNQLRYVFSAARLPTRREQRLFPHLLVTSATSLGKRRGLVAGGDGATLFPFERAARSDDGGQTWKVFRIAKRHGEQPYDGGDAVLPDGRLLVLLDAWSGDGRRPSPRYHGLWRSGRSDWSALRPYRPVFRPALGHAPHGEPELQGLSASPEAGLLVVTTWDSRLYVSDDGGRVFRQVPAR